MTQTELGELFGENQAFISSLERRQRRIDMWEFVRLCRALDIKPSDVLNPLFDGLALKKRASLATRLRPDTKE